MLVVTLNRGEELFVVGFRWMIPLLPDSHNLTLHGFVCPHVVHILYWYTHMILLLLLYWTTFQTRLPFLPLDQKLQRELVVAGVVRTLKIDHTPGPPPSSSARHLPDPDEEPPQIGDRVRFEWLFLFVLRHSCPV
jgi:hypothetical protein